MCRDCVELGVEITYAGVNFDYPTTYPYVNPEDQFTDVRQFIRETIYPNLGWMTSLKKLVLIKFGDFLTTGADFGSVESFMLSDLLTWLFSEDDERSPGSLRHLWIQDFQLRPYLYQSIHLSAQLLVSYQLTDHREFSMEPQPFSRFPKLEYVSQLKFCEDNLPLHLPTNVKYVQAELCCYNDEHVRKDFKLYNYTIPFYFILFFSNFLGDEQLYPDTSRLGVLIC